MSNVQAMERMRNYLWNVIQQGALNRTPGMAETVLTALQSSNPEWVTSVFNLVRIQDLQTPKEIEEPEQAEPLFREPENGVPFGEILVGKTIPSGHVVGLPLESFGQRGHVLVAGTIGTGKSMILNMTSAQLMARGIVTIVYDSLNQAAQLLAPVVAAERLNIVDFKDYRRNFLLGPPGMPQLEWIRQASAHLIESLEMSPVTMNYLIEVCAGIIESGQTATVLKVIQAAQQGASRSQSARALLNRLLPLVMSGDGVFACERGFDMDKFFSRSCILNLKDAPAQVCRLISNDHYFYLTKCTNALDSWRLKMVFVYHEAGSMLNRAGDFFLCMVREARNYGIGLCFADQAPQLENPALKANIGTKMLLRLEDPASLEGFRVGMALKEEHRAFVLNMEDRTLLLRRPDIPYPFLVRVPELR